MKKVAVLAKPFDIDDLLDVVKQALTLADLISTSDLEREDPPQDDKPHNNH